MHPVPPTSSKPVQYVQSFIPARPPSINSTLPSPNCSLILYHQAPKKTLRRTPSLRSLETVIPWEWKSEKQLLSYLYWNGRAWNLLVKAAEDEQAWTGETVIYNHPLLQSALFLHPGVDTDYIRDFVEYQLSVHYPRLD